MGRNRKQSKRTCENIIDKVIDEVNKVDKTIPLELHIKYTKVQNDIRTYQKDQLRRAQPLSWNRWFYGFLGYDNWKAPK